VKVVYVCPVCKVVSGVGWERTNCIHLMDIKLGLIDRFLRSVVLSKSSKKTRERVRRVVDIRTCLRSMRTGIVLRLSPGLVLRLPPDIGSLRASSPRMTYTFAYAPPIQHVHRLDINPYL